MRKGIGVGTVVCLGLCGWLGAVDPVVSNVLGHQRPGTRLVDITYDVADADSATLRVSLAVSCDGGLTWTVPCTSVSGDVGADVVPGAGKAIVWDAGADWHGHWSERMRARVLAEDPVPPEYVAIDVSAGSGVGAVYPVTGLSREPVDLLTNDAWRTTTILLRRVPGAPPYVYSMGSPSGELGHLTNETQHEVTLTQAFFPLYIGVFEVTQKQWERVMGTWPSYFSNVSLRDGRPVERVSYSDIRGATLGAGWPASHAVDAASFLGRLRAKTSPPLASIDLPTEAQWEAACRAGTTTALNNGTPLASTAQDPNMDILARYWCNGGSDGSQGSGLDTGSAKAGTYLPNAWGLYDLHGNVWEWCLDWYQNDLGISPASDPVGPVAGEGRVIRGGCWSALAAYCRSADRYLLESGVGMELVGLRLAFPAGP